MKALTDPGAWSPRKEAALLLMWRAGAPLTASGIAEASDPDDALTENAVRYYMRWLRQRDYVSYAQGTSALPGRGSTPGTYSLTDRGRDRAQALASTVPVK